jgi:hypothetical protein
MQVYSLNVANPNTAGLIPTYPQNAAIFYQTPSLSDGSNVWFWDIPTQSWSQFSQ